MHVCEPILVDTCNLHACSVFLGLLSKCDHNFAHFFSNNARHEDLNALSFGANYNSVAQKLRILAIKEILSQKVHL